MNDRKLLLISTSTTFGTSYLDHAEEAIRRRMGTAKKILFVPYALSDRQAYANKARARFEAMGFELTSIHEEADPRRAAAEAEAFFVGGGNTFRLLKTLYDENLVTVIRERVSSGAVYMGASAGTNVACVSIRTTNDMPIVYPPSFDALGLVPFNINPHFLDADPTSRHMGETRETRIREFHEENSPFVIGLREGSWLELDGALMRLGGTTGAKLFQRGADPRELAPGAMAV